jgi:hypothetical protein
MWHIIHIWDLVKEYLVYVTNLEGGVAKDEERLRVIWAISERGSISSMLQVL